MNRLTHGFCSPACIIPGEDGAILMALINDLKAEFEPSGPSTSKAKPS
jgi:hypothetical protein